MFRLLGGCSSKSCDSPKRTRTRRGSTAACKWRSSPPGLRSCHTSSSGRSQSRPRHLAAWPSLCPCANGWREELPPRRSCRARSVRVRVRDELHAGRRCYGRHPRLLAIREMQQRQRGPCWMPSAGYGMRMMTRGSMKAGEGEGTPAIGGF